MPAGRRFARTGRQSVPSSVSLIQGDITSSRYSALGATVPTLPGLETPVAPKHFPFPNTPVENDIVFEVLMFTYSVIATALQFLHLYRTIWWLPHSYTSQALNFYLIDPHLVIFIMAILLRRVVHIIGCTIISAVLPQKYLEISCSTFRLILFQVIFFMLCWSSFYVMQRNPILSILYLCYPFTVYVMLFGFNTAPFFDMTSSYVNLVPPLHACSLNAGDIRKEVDSLKTDFNNRMKQILFHSFLNAYYAGFIPCCFAQCFLFYDITWATQHFFFVFLGCFSAFARHILPLRYCDTLHRAALHLGSWDKVETRAILPVAYSWQEDLLWPQGILVRHGKDMFKAQGDSNAAEPGNVTYSRFYGIFKNPSIPLRALLTLQILIIVFQISLLIRATYWYYIISATLLLFFSYHTLYKLGRDYLISTKIYKAEQTLHEKVYPN